MEDTSNTDIQDEEEVEEEALSLTDFPLTTDEFNDRRSSSEPTDLFEFFSENLTPQMSHAEDIIFSGKLLPLNQQPQTHQTHKDDTKLQNFQRRSESLSELKTSRSNSTKTRLLIRNSRSLDYKKLNRNSSISSETTEINRNISGSGFLKVPKPRWYVMMFGSVKFPPEMDLQDIKNRQVRSNTATLFPSFDSIKKVPVNRKSSWGLLKVLSCKDHASAAVTASFAHMPLKGQPITCHRT